MLAIVPFKGPDGAKTRLAAALSEEERARIAMIMFWRVLGACRRAPSIRRTLLVTPDPRMAPDGVSVLVDRGEGHPAAIALALAEAGPDEGVLVVMADLPLVDEEALEALANAARPLALAPARDGGVNALALREPGRFSPRFGLPAKEMIRAARRSGIMPVVVDDERLSLDVDRPADLAPA